MHSINSILYISNVDISLGKGPSVNEVEFIDAMLNDISLVNKEVFVPEVENDLDSKLKAMVTFFPTKFKKIKILNHIYSEYMIFKRLLRECFNGEFDAIFTRISIFPISLYLLSGILKGKFHVKTVGDCNFRYLDRIPTKILPTIARSIHVHMFKRIVFNAHSIDVVTIRHKKELECNLGLDNKNICRVIGNKVNLNKFYPRDSQTIKKELGIDNDSYILGYLGNDPLNRGAKELISVVNILRERKVNVTGVIIGEYDKKEIPTESLKYIISLGQVKYADVPELVNIFDIGVSFLPKWHRGACEQKVRQYIASGVVPIVTPGGSSFVEEEELGVVIDNNDLNRLSDVVYDTLESSVLSRYSSNCIDYAKSSLSHTLLFKLRIELFINE